MQLEDFNDAIKRDNILGLNSIAVEERKDSQDGTNYETSNDKNVQGKTEFLKKMNTAKVVPIDAKNEVVADEDDENMKAFEDDPAFVKKLGSEPYITFAEFSKYLSLFNPKIGLDEKIQCKNTNAI